MSKKPYYITTAITYTSGKPHIGNTYEIILADSIARYKRMEGYDVFFQTGTDEHGQKVELKAEEKGAILILASGRPTSGLMDLARELKMDQYHGLLVAYNGSKVIDCKTNETLFNQALSVEEGKAVLEHMKKFERVRPMIDKGEYMYVNNVYDNWITWKGEPFDVIHWSYTLKLLHMF